eukprot:2517064-Amphidinium_carterae.1
MCNFSLVWGYLCAFGGAFPLQCLKSFLTTVNTCPGKSNKAPNSGRTMDGKSKASQPANVDLQQDVSLYTQLLQRASKWSTCPSQDLSCKLTEQATIKILRRSRFD